MGSHLRREGDNGIDDKMNKIVAKLTEASVKKPLVARRGEGAVSALPRTAQRYLVAAEPAKAGSWR
jgi:hypothetical protein